MKLKDTFIVHSMDNETLLVPTGAAEFRGLAQGNKSVGVILGCLSDDTTIEEIVDTLSERFDGSVEDMRADVIDVIGQLRSIGALDE